MHVAQGPAQLDLTESENESSLRGTGGGEAEAEGVADAQSWTPLQDESVTLLLTPRGTHRDKSEATVGHHSPSEQEDHVGITPKYPNSSKLPYQT